MLQGETHLHYLGQSAEQGPKEQEMLTNLSSLQTSRPRQNELKLETQEHSVSL